MKRYLYSLLARYVSFHVLKDDAVLEVDPSSALMGDALRRRGVSSSAVKSPAELPDPEGRAFIVLNGNVHRSDDIQGMMTDVAQRCGAETRVIAIYYSSLWRPLARLATRLGWRRRTPEENWVAPGDMVNFAGLTGLDIITHQRRVLMPFYIPLLSALMNRFLAHLPILRSFCLVNLVLMRRRPAPDAQRRPRVSIVVAARNEKGHIKDIVRRVSQIGGDNELIFVEGGSSDGTWQEIQRVQEAWEGPLSIRSAQQGGVGKGDAVRTGFAMARGEILMILDADLTVRPEDLPKFYDAIRSRHGEFINGSRLVYPMEDRAMRFINMLGNKFFAAAFSFVLGQRLKDTLCGTKVLWRRDYERIAANRAYFGEFDPFGDFDLLFGASRLGLKIVELPVRYASRVYGDTNISRWTHGALLLRMLWFAARKIRFI